ncbi:procollagen-proline 4-dioxygenase [Aureococcus anophagefferens]|uniref:Procollagen-proline 4-dioxygenase n=1 Tax=Aureococcus anophagefferens TaxID=44056 RepID=A0ABR1FH04_AURAN
MPWLRVAALSAGVAAFQNAPQTKGALKSLRAAWLEEQQSVTGSDGKYGQSGTEAEVAAQAALDAIRADGRLALDAEAEQAAWEAAWIAATVANLERMKSEKDFAAQAVEVKGYVPPLSGKVSGAVESYAPAASTGNMDHFASTAGSFKGKDRDFKSMGASSGPDWLSGSAAPAAAAPRGRGSLKGKDRDFKSMGASSGPDWLSGSAAPAAAAPAAAVASPAASTGNMDHFKASTGGLVQGQGPRLQVHGRRVRPQLALRLGRPAAAVASPAASTGNMDHFAPTAGSLKGKDRDFKSMGASSGPDWLSGSAAPAAAAPAAAGKDRDFKSMGASSGPDWLSGSAAPAAAAPAAAVASPAASTGNMDHFASTAGSFKGKDRDFKSMGASSGPDWLSAQPPPRPPPPRPRSASPAASTGNMDHSASTAGSFKGKDRDFKSMGASSGPDWLSGSAAPRPRSPWTTSASTAGSFKGKDRDFKSMGASSGPDWLSGFGRPVAAAPAAAVASPAASTGNMDHFGVHGGLVQGKDRDFKSMGASSGPDWLLRLGRPAAAAPRPRSRPRRPPRATWTTSAHAGSFKGKDRDFKSMGASSGPDWLSGSAAPAAAAPRPRSRPRRPPRATWTTSAPRRARSRARTAT